MSAVEYTFELQNHSFYKRGEIYKQEYFPSCCAASVSTNTALRCTKNAQKKNLIFSSDCQNDVKEMGKKITILKGAVLFVYPAYFYIILPFILGGILFPISAGFRMEFIKFFEFLSLLYFPVQYLLFICHVSCLLHYFSFT